MKRSRFCCLVTCVLAASLCTAAGAIPAYTITDLGTLGGSASHASSVSSTGLVVGWSNVPSGNEHAFLWQGSAGMRDLGTIEGGFDSYAYGVNASGSTAGWSSTRYGDHHAVLWDQAGTILDLSAGGNLYAWAINDAGDVVGDTSDGMGNWGTFVWTAEAGRVLATLPASQGHAINDAGAVAGVSWAWGLNHAFVWSWQWGKTTWLPDLPGDERSGAWDINDSYQVVGASYHLDYRMRPVMWFPDGLGGWQAQYLGSLGGNGTAAAINASGQVVGASEDASGRGHPFLWDSGAGMRDLNSLIDPLSGWALSEATDINDSGWIVGQGFHNGQWHAFLLTPVPEPSSLLALLCGLGALAGAVRSRRERRK